MEVLRNSPLCPLMRYAGASTPISFSFSFPHPYAVILQIKLGAKKINGLQITTRCHKQKKITTAVTGHYGTITQPSRGSSTCTQADAHTL